MKINIINEKINFIITEIIRLEDNFDENWELIFRYLVKFNSILSNDKVNNNIVFEKCNYLLNNINNKNLKTIINIYISEIFYNRAKKLESNLKIGKTNFKEIPSFVKNNNKIKTNCFKLDEKFKNKNIDIVGGWLDIKNPKKFYVEL